jgi:hypothetical protein
MFENRRASIRRIVDRLVDNAITEDGRPNVTPTDIAAWTFGECQFHISLDEATAYLNAALVKRGYRPSA